MRKDTPAIYEFDGFLLDEIHRSFSYHGVEIRLTKRNFDVLRLLVEKHGFTVDKTEFFEKVWADTFVEDGNLAVSITALRKVFESRSKSFIETIPRRGYKFTADVKKIYEDDDFEPDIPADAVETPSKSQTLINSSSLSQPATTIKSSEKQKKSNLFLPFPHKRNFQIILITGFLFGLFSGFFFYFYQQKEGKKGILLENPKIVVLPFTNLKPDPATDYLGLAFSESVANSLDGMGDCEVVRNPAIAENNNVNEIIDEYRKNRKVDLIVTGTYLVNENDVEVFSRLVNIHIPGNFFTATFTIPKKDILNAPRLISTTIVNSFGFGTELTSLSIFVDPENLNKEAHDHFLKAVHLRFQENEAIPHAEKAVEIEPGFYAGWLFLAFEYRIAAAKNIDPNVDYYQKAIEAIETAQKIEPDDARPKILLAKTYAELNRLEEALQLYKQIPNNKSLQVEKLRVGAYIARYGGLLDESIALSEKARNFNKISKRLITAYFYKGDYEAFKESIDYETGRPSYVSFYLGLIGMSKNDTQAIRENFQITKSSEFGNLFGEISRAILLHLDGKTAEALEILQKAEKVYSAGKYIDSELNYLIVIAYSYLEDKEGALRAFKRSVDGGFVCYPYFLNDPFLNKFKDDDRFKESLEVARQRHEKFKAAFYAEK